MNASFRDELTRLASPAVAATITKGTSELAASLAPVLAAASPSDAKQLLGLFVGAVIAEIEAAGGGSVAKTPVPPEVVQQALRDFDEKATAEAIRQLRETGGLTLSEFYADLEQLIRRE
jgi:hypothetical protein